MNKLTSVVFFFLISSFLVSIVAFADQHAESELSARDILAKSMGAADSSKATFIMPRREGVAKAIIEPEVTFEQRIKCAHEEIGKKEVRFKVPARTEPVQKSETVKALMKEQEEQQEAEQKKREFEQELAQKAENSRASRVAGIEALEAARAQALKAQTADVSLLVFKDENTPVTDANTLRKLLMGESKAVLVTLPDCADDYKMRDEDSDLSRIVQSAAEYILAAMHYI